MRKNGLHFLGMVKQSHKQFPRAYLTQEALYTERGDSVVVETNCDGVTLLGVGWNDSKIQSIIATRGVTLPGADHIVWQPRWTGPGVSETKEVRVPQPRLVGEYFEGAKGVDCHNHSRQGDLAIEQGWRTHTWWKRIMATMLGIVVTDA